VAQQRYSYGSRSSLPSSASGKSEATQSTNCNCA
jgi:hypothetical protein